MAQLNNSEAKMLLMHEGRPIYVGASEPGTRVFRRLPRLAARLRCGALSEAAGETTGGGCAVGRCAGPPGFGEARLWPAGRWENNGSLGGAFAGGNSSPVVEDVNGRIALKFAPGQSMEFVPGPELSPIREFTVMATVLNPSLEAGECVVEVEDTDGKRVGLLTEPPMGAWQQLAVAYRGGRGVLYTNGTASSRSAPPAPGQIKSIRLGGRQQFSGALSRVQFFRRALSAAEISQLHAVWKSEWQSPNPNPAAFAQNPAALDLQTVAMIATRGRSDLGTVEYRFAEVTGAAGANSSGWVPAPFFLDDGLQPGNRYSYSVVMRDPLGNVSAPSPVVEAVTDPSRFQEFTDRFEAARDFLMQGTSGTIWDGVLGKGEDSAPEAVIARDGIVRLQSKGTVWDGGKPLGAFLFKVVPGDFVAQVKVVDYAGLATRKVPGNNDGGLMVRAPRVRDAGPGEDLLQLNFFPIWNQGNMVTSLDGGRSQKGNGLAWDAHRFLQIIRQGNLFYFRTSSDGKGWKEMPGSPVEREDMAGLPLQVGLYHASYGAESSHVAFTDFQITLRK